MKEKEANNLALIEFLEQMQAEGKTQTEMRDAASQKFQVTRHSLRAWMSRLKNPKKYEGKYTSRIAPFMKKTKNEAQSATAVS
jgi:hypothetical protein